MMLMGVLVMCNKEDKDMAMLQKDLKAFRTSGTEKNRKELIKVASKLAIKQYDETLKKLSKN